MLIFFYLPQIFWLQLPKMKSDHTCFCRTKDQLQSGILWFVISSIINLASLGGKSSKLLQHLSFSLHNKIFWANGILVTSLPSTWFDMIFSCSVDTRHSHCLAISLQGNRSTTWLFDILFLCTHQSCFALLAAASHRAHAKLLCYHICFEYFSVSSPALQLAFMAYLLLS